MRLVVPEVLGFLVILGQIFVLASIIYLISGRKLEILNKFFNNKKIILTFVVALVATSGSLFFSEIMHFEPCRLCWFQRIFMYPQVLILAIAWWRQDLSVRLYSFALSLIGILISIYHYYIQNFNIPTTCSINSADSCTVVSLSVFNYITIPMMALTAFAMIITLWTVYNEK